MKKSIKSIMMCVLALMMCFTFAETAKADTDTTLYILGEEITGDTASGNGWRFERATEEGEYSKLYLNNAELTADDSTANTKIDGQCIEMRDNLEIVLSGNNTINMNITEFNEGLLDVIFANNLIISGTGSLTIKCSDIEFDMGTDVLLIFAQRDLVIKEGVQLNVEGMNIKISYEYLTIYYGIYADNTITIEPNTKVNVSGMNITEQEEREVEWITMGGIVGYSGVNIKDNAQINVSMGELEAEGLSCLCIAGYEVAIGNNSKLMLNIGNVKGTGDDGVCYGIDGDNVKIGDNCNVVYKSKVNGKNVFDYGIHADELDIGDGSTISIDTGDDSYGIGMLSSSFTIGKDSIVKTYGSFVAFAIWTVEDNDDTFPYLVYGGNNRNDLKEVKYVWDEGAYTVYYNDEYAKYAEIGNLLTINLNANGGTVDRTSFTMHNGHAIGTLPTPTRTGYTFTGWYTAKSGGTKVYSTTKLTKSMTLYAQWKKTTYNITLNANGGSVGTSKIVVEYNGKLGTLPTPTRTGYTFTGWYTAKTGGTKVYSTTKPTKSMTLYAQWKIKTYTINFDGNGGTVGVEKKWVDHGNAMEFMPTPKRTGYTFTGWYTAKSGGSKVYSTTKVTKNMTLYAQWKKNTCTITFNANGGKVSTTSKTVNGGTAIGTMPTPTRSGYTFTGWYTAKTGGIKVYTTTKATANMTLYAQWKKK